MLVTEPTEPDPLATETTTVPPDAVSGFAYASRSATVIVEVDEPSADSDVDDAVTTDAPVLADPGFTVIVAESDNATPSSVAQTNTVPVDVGGVTAAEYMPDRKDVEPTEPAVVRITTSPTSVVMIPPESANCTVAVTVEPPAVVVDDDTESVEVLVTSLTLVRSTDTDPAETALICAATTEVPTEATDVNVAE